MQKDDSSMGHPVVLPPLPDHTAFPPSQRMDAHRWRGVGINARDCTVRRISKAEATDFLQRYHSLGMCLCRYRYGLFLGRDRGLGYGVGTLVAVSTFAPLRNMTRPGPEGRPVTVRSAEWLRYCSLPQLRVRGGMGKMLRFFVDEVHPDDVMTYAMVEPWKEALMGDPAYGVAPLGDSYLKLGFKEEGRIRFRGGESVKWRLVLRDD